MRGTWYNALKGRKELKSTLRNSKQRQLSRFPERGKSLDEIAAQYNIDHSILRNWKSEFLENASTIFENPKKAE